MDLGSTKLALLDAITVPGCFVLEEPRKRTQQTRILVFQIRKFASPSYLISLGVCYHWHCRTRYLYWTAIPPNLRLSVWNPSAAMASTLNGHIPSNLSPTNSAKLDFKSRSADRDNHLNPYAISQSWLSRFSDYLQSNDISALVKSLFLTHGWFRDSLTFTWDTRSLSGHDNIISYIASNMKTTLYGFALDDTPELEPRYGVVNTSPKAENGGRGIEFGFKFESNDIIGRGYVRLMQESGGQGEWKALTVFTKAVDLKGYEETGPEEGTYDGHTLAWKDVSARRRSLVETDPEVLIIGAGQSGIELAACLRQMNIRALIVEKNARVGDSWRKRYPTLSLHTVRSYCPFKYQPYPKNWPIFPSRDKVADWMEQYAISQELVVWTNSTVVPKPSFDPSTSTWTVFVDRAGTVVKLRPKHIALATGVAHKPRIPKLVGMDLYKGVSFHSSEYRGGAAFTGKRAIVVGACNTAADICQDLQAHGAASVTMVQRTATCVVTRESASKKLSAGWPEGIDVEISDFKMASLPFALLKSWERDREEEVWEYNREMYTALRKTGFKVTLGKDGSGQLVMFFERGGGYFIDVGCAELICSGKVKVKQGAEPTYLTSDGMIFNDGTFLPADVVVFATGYENAQASVYDIFGPDIANGIRPLWGTDAEGELRGTYRPSGHPALWYAVGNFMWARHGAKQLAIQIKATDIGLIRQELDK